MGYPHELGLTEKKRMLVFFCSCLTIHNEVQDVWLYAGWKKYAQSTPNSTMTCFCTLSPLTFLPLNDIHMFCLYFVYLPRINVHLQQWVTAWIHHPLRTARNHTPMQLWTEGMLTQQHDEHQVDDEDY